MDDLRSVARKALWYSSWRLTAALNWTHIDFSQILGSILAMNSEITTNLRRFMAKTGQAFQFVAILSSHVADAGNCEANGREDPGAGHKGDDPMILDGFSYDFPM